ncbi:MAG: hypothetical protein QOH25_138 [Acidobacteriota bacterium]|jgi:hypothetical protein|nr:hypothetical protein [Acidobacteriota bacterium]
MQRHRRDSSVDRIKLILVLTFTGLLAVIGTGSVRSVATNDVKPARASSLTVAEARPVPQQTPAPAAFQEGCITCHSQIEPMHETKTAKLEEGRDGQKLSCAFCHGGNPAEKVNKEQAHVQPRFPDEWKRNNQRTTSNPERTNTLLAKESREFVRFINPGDLRVADQTCGSCHQTENQSVSNSMMRHGAMLWGAALYNNGGFPLKDTRFGESYSDETGAPERLIQQGEIKPEEMVLRGILPYLDPLPRWEISQPGNILRVFERGGKRRLEVGLPDKDEDAGRPDKGLSPRGFGTAQRTDPVYLGLQKTRLLDPTLNFLGTNDHPGDYRSSGCTACHVIYANDSSSIHSGLQYAKFGNQGTASTADKSFDNLRNEPGHPIRHQLTRSIPTSQCMVCHMHPGTNMVSTYLGMTWWDNETDGRVMYPAKQEKPSQDEEQEKLNRNPEASSLRGLWSDPNFLNQTGKPEFNKQLTRTQFADFHGHGWIFRAVFKRNRRGELIDRDDNPLLDASGKPVTSVEAEKLWEAVNFKDTDNAELTNKAMKPNVPVHLKDIHLEKGMHCVDCHFSQDAHGNGVLYNEPRAAVEIACTDCHGSISEKGWPDTPPGGKAVPPLTSGPAAGKGITRDGKYEEKQGRNLSTIIVPWLSADGSKVRLFEKIRKEKEVRKDASGKDVTLLRGDVIQNSMVEPNVWWRVKQTVDTITEGSRDYNWKSHYAKTVRLDDKDQLTWGEKGGNVAHPDSKMSCMACHSSWMTSCFGCHLSMTANRKMPNRHNEGGNTRNFTTYNFQVLRDDVFMLGVDGTATGHRVAPVRSSSAVLVSSQNQNREWIYSQQQTTSAEGFSGQTFNTHVPHTVRARETRDCSDCHISKDNDNNAWLAQTYLQGTNFVNFMGRYVYVAAEDALEVVPVTERTEPQAVYGSTLHKLAYPQNYDNFVNKEKRKLSFYFEHVGNPKVLQVQLRGEYAYVAAGEGGLRVYDVAQIDHKGFSERITTAPVSPFGQKFYVKTKYAAAVAAPSTLAVDPARWRLDREVGWFDPLGSDEKSQRAWARWRDWSKLPIETRNKTVSPWVNEEQPIHPLYAYLYVADREEGLILVGAATLLDGDPLNNYLKRALDPKVYSNGAYNPDGALSGANNITIAGTYAYITTESALVIININDPLKPERVGSIPLNHPRAVAVQFRYGFVVDADGLKVIDVTNPERARLVDGSLLRLNDAHDVYVARTYAYVANGHEGIAIVDVENPEKPALYMMYDAKGETGGALRDTHQVKVAMTNASLYAYVADGAAGLRVLQLTDPETMLTSAGFSPRPQPRLIATFQTKGAALAISKGLDRDRAVDESGNQTAVFGRRGARPFTLEEMQKMYLTKDGHVFTVTDIRALDEKTPLPRAQNSLVPNDALPSIMKPKLTGTIETGFAVSGTTKTGVIVGGLGLFLIIISWRKLRRKTWFS